MVLNLNTSTLRTIDDTEIPIIDLESLKIGVRNVGRNQDLSDLENLL